MSEVSRRRNLANTEAEPDHETVSPIKNRDIPPIWELKDLKDEVERMEAERSWLQDRMYSITRSLTGMPGGGKGRGGFEEIMARISETDERYHEMIRMLTREVNRVERIIRNIESANMRRFVRMYYKDHTDKKTVMEKMKLTEYGFRRARESIESARSMAEVRWKEKFIMEAK